MFIYHEPRDPLENVAALVRGEAQDSKVFQEPQAIQENQVNQESQGQWGHQDLREIPDHRSVDKHFHNGLWYSLTQELSPPMVMTKFLGGLHSKTMNIAL